MRPFNRTAHWLMLALALAACSSPAATATPLMVATTAPTVAATTAATIAPATAATTAAPTLAPTTLPAATQPAATRTEGLFLARPEGGAGPLLAYDPASGALRFTLPAGRLSADGAFYFAATPNGDNTLFTGYDLTTGAANLQATVTGHWQLGAVSPNGRWAALARIFPAAQAQQWTDTTWRSEIQIVDTRAGQAEPTIKLDGNFEVDGLSSAGDALYLIQYLPAARPDHYEVRLYDRGAGALQDGALVDKRAANEVMVGERWAAVGSPNGEWLLSLYLRTKAGTAFIHALNLANHYTWCIDLPSPSANLEQLKDYTLALAPDGRTIFAANAALGLVARVNLDDLNVVQAAQFPSASRSAAGQPLPPSTSIVAPDGRALYFTNGAQAWAYDDQGGAVRAFGGPGPITGLGVSLDGRRVFVARAGQPLMIVDAASGSALGY